MVKPIFLPTREEAKGPKVFISYRRADSPLHVRLLRDSLAAEFGPDAVFLDTDDIPPGDIFPEEIRDTIKASYALLVVIGPRWAGDGSGNRLHAPGDFVREEIKTALGCKGVKVIPVLVGGAEMPRGDELPEDIAALADHNAAKILDTHRDYDTQNLIAVLRDLLPPKPEPPSPFERFNPAARLARHLSDRPAAGAAFAVLILVALLLAAAVYSLGPQGFDSCINHQFEGTPLKRVAAIEAGTSDTVFKLALPEDDHFVLRLTTPGGDLGAVAFHHLPDSQEFMISRVVGPDCLAVTDYENASRPGSRHTLRKWDSLRLRLGDKTYRLRLSDHGDDIRASFDAWP